MTHSSRMHEQAYDHAQMAAAGARQSNIIRKIFTAEKVTEEDLLPAQISE
jgi:hypothetical protein